MPGAYSSTMLAASAARSTVIAVRRDAARFGARDLQQRRQRALHAVELLERRRHQLVRLALTASVPARNCASSSRTRSRYSGVRRSCAMLSNAARSVVVCCSMRSSIAFTAHGQRIEFVARSVDAQPLREIALHDGFAGGGVVAHAARGAPRIGGAQQPHAQRGQRDAPERRQAEAAQHVLALAGVGADQQPVAVRQVLDARLDRMQHRFAAFVRGDVELHHRRAFVAARSRAATP